MTTNYNLWDRQKPKKVVYLGKLKAACPTCDWDLNRLIKKKYCPRCKQFLDWDMKGDLNV